MWETRFLWKLRHFVVNTTENIIHNRFGATFRRPVYDRYNPRSSQFQTDSNDSHHRRGQNTFVPPILTVIAAVSWPFGKLKDTDEVETVTKQLFTDALRCIWVSDFVRAERTLNKLLRHLSAANRRRLLSDEQYVIQRARVCAELANVNLAMNNLSEAEKLIKQVIRNSATAGVPVTNPMIVEMSLKLALIYQRMSRMEEASSGFLYCINTQRTKLDAEDIKDSSELANEEALLGMCENYYSKFLFETGKSTEALEHAQKALEMANKLYKEDHSNCLHLLCDVAVILLDLNQFVDARSSLERAEKLTRAKLDQDSTSESEGLLSCLAHILLQRLALEAQDGQLTLAKTYAKEIKQIASLMQAPRTVLDQLKDYRKRYNLNA